LAIQLHNDNSGKCKKLCHIALKYLLEKVKNFLFNYYLCLINKIINNQISIEQRDELFIISLALFKDENKPLHKRIAALLVKIFVEIEGNQFERRLEEVLKIISLEINFDHFNQVNFLCIKTTMLLFEIILLFLEHE
jgi:hypothetical protein